jgi:hypothetical protein
MPEQKTTHQLRRRIRHLEHNLWDITAHCSVEREHRMSLKALVGVRSSSLFESHVLSFRSHIQRESIPFHQMFPIGITT